MKHQMNNMNKWGYFLSECSDRFQKKTIMYMFICDYESPCWRESVEILKSLDLPTSIETSKGHHGGLSLQVLLDTNLEDSIKYVTDILTLFPCEPLIVISEVHVIFKKIPIGHYFDNDLIQPSRYFDKLVKENKKGVFVHDGTIPKIIKNNKK
jgi:hypothetical protein